MSDSHMIIIIAGSAIMTYLTRFPLMIISGKKKIPGKLEAYMSYIAPAVLTALIAPGIFITDGKLDISIGNEYIAASAITVLVAYYSKNMLASVITGVCTAGILAFLLR